MEAKILALNASIQATRLGVAGESFRVIAQEMKHFSESVNEANQGVRELADGLLNVLPRIRSLAADMSKTSEGFSQDIGERVGEVAATNAELKQQVADSMSAGEVRLQQILQLSYDALSHLQFQDTVAQGLLSADTEMKAAIHLAARWVEQGDQAIIENEPTQDADNERLESGEVMLF
jgi:methyl-accepting chemotaxis protein